MVKIRSKRGKKILALLLVGLCMVIFAGWQNNSIVITKSDCRSVKIPPEFNGCVIAHISDLHNKEFGKNQKILLSKLKSTSPDLIVITGDLIDRRRFDLSIAMSFIEGAVQIAPVYYVSGNHEAWSNKYPLIKSSLLRAGVQVLDDSMVELSRGKSSINLLGLKDPAFLSSNYIDGTDLSQFLECLQQWSANEGFQILLSHRPELFDLYAENHMDLIFSGHAHGGQVRLPLLGGLVAPDQGFFPRYTSGCYKQNGSAMLVSRGLGNSIFPVRVFNRPEIVVVTLKSPGKNG